MESFETLSTFDTRRGLCYLVQVPDELLAERDPRTLVGETILLDDRQVRVAGVETHAVVWEPGKAALKTIGLVID